MHCLENTNNGRFGFVAQDADGQKLTEFEYTWDELPQKLPIKTLAVVDRSDGRVLVTIGNYEKYLFSNEAVAVGTFVPASDGSIVGTHIGGHTLTAKFLGGINGDKAVRVKVDFYTPHGVDVTCDEFLASSLPYSPIVYRPGLKD